MNLKLVSFLSVCTFVVACGDSATDTVGGGNTGGNGNNDGGSGAGTDVLSTGGNNTGASPSVGAGGAGAGEPGDGICGSELFTGGGEPPGPTYDGCLSANCCETFDPCLADPDCTDCLESGGEGCEGNALYTAYSTCQDTNCPSTICGTDLGIQASPNANACIQGNCCGSFNPCEEDIDCNACLQDPMVAGCDVNVLFTAYQECLDENCPSDICGSQISFVTTYDNDAQDANYELTLCAQEGCCAEMTACADPDADGYLEMDDPGVADCLDCLQGLASCPAAIEPAAEAFNTCFEAACPQ
jgi:hypothetical protein